MDRQTDRQTTDFRWYHLWSKRRPGPDGVVNSPETSWPSSVFPRFVTDMLAKVWSDFEQSFRAKLLSFSLWWKVRRRYIYLLKLWNWWICPRSTSVATEATGPRADRLNFANVTLQARLRDVFQSFQSYALIKVHLFCCWQSFKLQLRWLQFICVFRKCNDCLHFLSKVVPCFQCAATLNETTLQCRFGDVLNMPFTIRIIFRNYIWSLIFTVSLSIYLSISSFYRFQDLHYFP